MKYLIKGFMIENNDIVCRFKALMANFDDVVSFLERVRLDAYDVVKVVPKDFESEV